MIGGRIHEESSSTLSAEVDLTKEGCSLILATVNSQFTLKLAFPSGVKAPPEFVTVTVRVLEPCLLGCRETRAAHVVLLEQSSSKMISDTSGNGSCENEKEYDRLVAPAHPPVLILVMLMTNGALFS